MSRLRSSFLEMIRILGNHSGCHQLPERSFFYKGKQFPVCARCTGVTIGEFSALIAMALGIRISLTKSIILLLTMGFDWFIQAIHIKKSTNIRRLLTGFLGGFGLFYIYFHGIRTLIFYIYRKYNE